MNSSRDKNDPQTQCGLSSLSRLRRYRPQGAVGTHPAFDRLLARHAGLIGAVAAQYGGPGVEREDLLQEGRIGFLKAVETFDAGKGPFPAWPTRNVRWSILDHLARQSGPFRVPRTVRETWARVDRAEDELRQLLRRAPTQEETAQHLGMDDGEMAEVLRLRQRFIAASGSGAGVAWEEESAAAGSGAACSAVSGLISPGVQVPERHGAAPPVLDELVDVGQIMRLAALLAPLSPEERRVTLRASLTVLQAPIVGRPTAPKDRTALSRARSRWRSLGWAEWLADPDIPFRPEVFDRLLAEVQHPYDGFAREHAAFCVWVMHAVPDVRRRHQLVPDRLRILAEAVLAQAVDRGDPALLRIATGLWGPTAPGRLLGDGSRPELISPVVRGDGLGEAQVLDLIGRSAARLHAAAGPPTGDLFVLWDGSTGLRRHPPLAREYLDVLPRGMRSRHELAHLLAMNSSRADAEAARSHFLAARRLSVGARAAFARDNRAAFAMAVEEVLGGTSGRPLAQLLRRSAALSLQHLGPTARVRLALGPGLRDPSPFVRHTVVSRLRGAQGGDVLDEVRRHLMAYERAPNISSALTANLLQILVIRALDSGATPAAVSTACTATAHFMGSPNHRLRGEALAWGGELWRRAQTVPAWGELWGRLLGEIPGREFAINVAQILMAPLGLPDPSPENISRDLGEDAGLAEGYSLPLWRTNLG